MENLKIKSTVFSMAVALAANAQWNTPNGNNSTNGASWRSGNVGIGYANPISTPPPLAELLTLNADAGDGLNILKGTNTGYAFAVHDNTGGRFAIWHDGGVAIGNAGYSTARLNIAVPASIGNTAAFDLYKTGESNPKYRIYDNGATVIGNPGSASSPHLSTDGAMLTVDGKGAKGLNMYINDNTSYAMAIHNVDHANTAKFAIWNSGGVTMGLTSYVGAKLNLGMPTSGGAGAAFDVFQNGNSKPYFRVYDNGATIIGNSNNLANMISTQGCMLTIDGKSAGGVNLEVNNNSSYALAVHNMDLQQGKFAIWKDGRVNIGNTGAPNLSHLSVNVDNTNQSAIEVYNMSGSKMEFQVKGNGKVFCRELTVTNASPFPDYVFDPNYKLKPLNEVAAYIAANKHLPGFESAAFYEENGLNTSELLIKQQEKIEELTLYIIELGNRLNRLERLED